MGSLLTNIILILILLALVGGACFYIYKEKKKGAHCIGCPYAASCPKHSTSGCCSNKQGIER